MTLNHSIHALMVGMSENWWRAGIMPCVRSDLERDKPVAYIFWLVEGPNGPVVVDTGYHPDYVAPEWAKGKNFIDAPTLLRELGVKAEEIKTVIVTHFHQDHFTGFDYFPSAKFVMSVPSWIFGPDRSCATRSSTDKSVPKCAQRWND